ncbi:MAG: glycosyltransferase [Polyangiales bacterium]
MTAPITVLFLNDTARNGGPGRSLHAILSFLDPAEVRRLVLLPREDVISTLLRDSGCTEEIVIDGDLVENPVQPLRRPVERDDLDAPLPVRAARLGVNSARFARLLATLPRLLRDRRVDLIYCNGTTADFVGGLTALASGVPALWHVRYTSIPPAVRALHKALSGSRAVSRIVCVSQASASLFPHAREKVAVVHNALDTERFRKGAVEGNLRGALVPEDAIVFGSMGRVLPRKGYPEMIRATRALIDTAPAEIASRVHAVVIGDTPADIPGDHLGECRALVRELGLEGRFHFPGFADDVRPALEDFDVVVLPSVYPDPLPRTVIEGMAYGLPVIAFDVGGVAEMVRDGETGALLRSHDVPALTAAMLAYASDPERRAREGAAARELATSAFDGRAHGKAIGAQIKKAVGR